MKRFAETILLAAKIREESYNKTLASIAETNSKSPIDYGKYYNKTLKTATENAVSKLKLDKEAKFPIYLLLEYCWNDILDWANYMKDKREDKVGPSNNL